VIIKFIVAVIAILLAWRLWRSYTRMQPPRR
jgi:hypothetical protein